MKKTFQTITSKSTLLDTRITYESTHRDRLLPNFWIGICNILL